jgi:hypothetical protein
VWIEHNNGFIDISKRYDTIIVIINGFKSL